MLYGNTKAKYFEDSFKIHQSTREPISCDVAVTDFTYKLNGSALNKNRWGTRRVHLKQRTQALCNRLRADSYQLVC